MPHFFLYPSTQPTTSPSYSPHPSPYTFPYPTSFPFVLSPTSHLSLPLLILHTTITHSHSAPLCTHSLHNFSSPSPSPLPLPTLFHYTFRHLTPLPLFLHPLPPPFPSHPTPLARTSRSLIPFRSPSPNLPPFFRPTNMSSTLSALSSLQPRHCLTVSRLSTPSHYAFFSPSLPYLRLSLSSSSFHSR